MNTISKERRDAIRAAAEKATPGPWEVGPVDDTVVTHLGADGLRYEVAGIDGDYNSPDEWPTMEANAAHIANCDPQTILALLDALDAAEKAEPVEWQYRDKRVGSGEWAHAPNADFRAVLALHPEIYEARPLYAHPFVAVGKTIVASGEQIEAAKTLIREAIRFAVWASGEGIGPDPLSDEADPDVMLMDYTTATGDDDWDTLADRLPALLDALDAAEKAEPALWITPGNLNAVKEQDGQPTGVVVSMAADDDGTRIPLYTHPAPVEKAEPVAWMVRGHLRDGTAVLRLPVLTSREDADRYAACNPDYTLAPLYTHPAPAVREGWVTVPVEPTEEMIDEIRQQLPCTPGGVTDRTAAAVYEAMLAAAPEAK